MRKLFLISFVLITLFCISCNAQSSKKEVSGSSDKIEVYYFHYTARCVTCRTIEANARENLETLYPNQIKQGLITFQSINLEDASGKSLSEKLGVSGQTLLLVKGDQKINLTNEGFMYAMVKPEKFKEIINQKVDDLLIK
jgi:hypothetical protein